MDLLVRTPNWLGDCVMSFPAVNGILSEFPGTGLWSHPRVADLYRLFFPGVPVHDFPMNPGTDQYSGLLLMTNSFSSAMAGVKARIKRIIGTPGQGREALITEARRIPDERNRHHMLFYNALADAVGARAIPLSAPSFEPGHSPHVAIFAGARYGEAKVWRGYGTVASKLNLDCVFYGTSSERAYLHDLARGTGSAVVTGLTYHDLCCSLMSAEAVLGNDSGGVHLAAFLGRPTVAVFGSTSPDWTAPTGSSVSIVTGTASCSPCFRRKCRLRSPECMNSIDPSSVASIVEGIING